MLSGITLERGSLKARFTDNTERLIHIVDNEAIGYNGLASLIHTAQNKNIFSFAGCNYETSSTVPAAGANQEAWNAPRVSPLRIEQTGPYCVTQFQSARESSGLNTEIAFTLGETCLDQTVTAWPDHDVTSSDLVWASYMNQVQYTSLFFHGTLKGHADAQWLEMASAGHGGTKYRPFDPHRPWHELVAENPVLRESKEVLPENLAAMERVGFRDGEIAAFSHFYFGFVDNYVYLMIFREIEFYILMSGTGNVTVRMPAWDYAIKGGPQRAGEKRSYHVRLVYKPYISMDDVMREVDAFVKG